MSKASTNAPAVTVFDAPAEDVAVFLMRCLFTMFAEDVQLLPGNSFTKLLQDYRQGALGRISLETPDSRAASLALHAAEVAEKARLAAEKLAAKLEEQSRGKRGS